MSHRVPDQVSQVAFLKDKRYFSKPFNRCASWAGAWKRLRLQTDASNQADTCNELFPDVGHLGPTKSKIETPNFLEDMAGTQLSLST